jgi:hypothetical protein
LPDQRRRTGTTGRGVRSASVTAAMVSSARRRARWTWCSRGR